MKEKNKESPTRERLDLCNIMLSCMQNIKPRCPCRNTILLASEYELSGQITRRKLNNNLIGYSEVITSGELTPI